MRKKLLALLMCATMVLGTAVTASAYTNDDVEAAKKIRDQYDYFAGEFNDGAFGKTTDKEVKFSTHYQNGTKSITYYYAFTDLAGGYVKLDKDNKKPLAKATVELTATMDSVTNTGVSQLVVADPTTVVPGAVVKTTESGTAHYYYVSSVKTADAVAAGEAAVVTTPVAAVAASTKVAVLKQYDPTVATGAIINGVVTDFADEYGKDKDGYVPVTAATTTQKLYSTLSDGYYAAVTKATGSEIAIAEALANKTITKDAVALNIAFYKTVNAASPNVNEYGFKTIVPVLASRDDTNVSVKVDWLTRTNLKKANGVSVFLVDPYVTSITDWFEQINTVYKIADVKDGVFTADYLVSGTYIFDVAAAADNAGKTDADATKPAADNTASPKTGDVAPIAALAVVMMGAFGAMVVASKKRA